MAKATVTRDAQRWIVTGAGRGLGFEMTRQLLARGDRVIAGLRQPGRSLALTELAAAHPGHLHLLPLDVDDEKSIAEFAREAQMVGDTCDVLVNGAGVLVAGERFGALSAKTFDDTLRTNATGPLLVCQALAPLLARASVPRVANISSELGSIADTTGFHTPSYAMSKAALNMATRLVAAQLGRSGAIVVSLHPGWVRTDMGGRSAPLAPAESVRGLIRVIDALEAKDNGAFLDHRGHALAW